MDTESLTQRVVNTFQNYLAFLGDRPYLQAAVVIVVAVLAGMAVVWLMGRILKGITRRTKSDLDDAIIALLRSPVFVTVLLLGILAAIAIVEPGEGTQAVLKNSIKTIFIVFWLAFAIRATTAVLSYAVRHPNYIRAVQPATRPLFETGAKLIILSLGVYFILVSWGVDPVGWLATAGIAAVAIGLAAQETLGNLFAGISILADAPYKIGDYIVLDRVDRGKVTRIGIRSTRILTRDDLEVTVPNSIIARSKIINESAGRWMKQRLRIPVGVAYGNDVDQVKQALLEAVHGLDGVCDTPEPWVKFHAFGDSSLNFEIRCWTEDPDQRGRTTDRINTSVYKALARHGIQIPFPQRDLHIKEMPEGFLRESRLPRPTTDASPENRPVGEPD